MGLGAGNDGFAPNGGQEAQIVPFISAQPVIIQTDHAR